MDMNHIIWSVSFTAQLRKDASSCLQHLVTFLVDMGNTLLIVPLVIPIYFFLAPLLYSFPIWLEWNG